MQKRTIIIIAVYAIMNIVSFLLMLIDKRLAKKGKARIPEPVLLGVSACFGELGGMIAMDVLKHKKKPLFQKWLPVFALGQVAIIGAFFYKFGL